MDNGIEKHDIDQVWGKVNTLDGVVSETQKDLAGVKASLNALINEVRNLAQTVGRPKETNWVGVGMLLIAMVASAATYIQARLTPIEDDIEMHSHLMMTQIEGLEDRAYRNGMQDARLDHLESWVQDVDLRGSRKHILSTPEAMKGAVK
jgi:hypothetical protein